MTLYIVKVSYESQPYYVNVPYILGVFKKGTARGVKLVICMGELWIQIGEKEIYVGEEGGKMLQMEKFYVKWHEDFSKEISCD